MLSTSVEQVSSLKVLGVTIPNNLTWSSQISTLVKKANKRQIKIVKLHRTSLTPNQ